ncbi:ribosome hibernation-promoting factor, HPF/YfiA family [Micrococcus lylae]|uniref:Ribosome hibernation promoting factor n=2 Tax=Bacteria TaxID=2 RepID=A0ABY2K122_9MICC|nr:ribosome-associated translation inhibitor RaiA [Micrococcus lylae]TFI00335.1 ribosome-associated translation inhibitor RaiA [Micrococcus lylae]
MTIDVSFIARNITPSETYREHVRERVARLEHLAAGADSIEVKTSRPSSQRHSEQNVKVEVTLRGNGTVVRTEADDDDKTVAFDKAFTRLSERLRRLHDRRKDRRRQASVAEATADMVPVDSNVSLVEQVLAARKAEEEAAGMDVPEDTPVRIREKTFPVTPMTVDEAVDAMELVGHDFYLFQNSETGVPGVVYRRQGWQYGVISLDESLPADHAPDGGRERFYGEKKADAAE